MNKNKDKKDGLEDKQGKVERNEWRKLVNIIVAGVTLYILLAYNVFDYTGNIMGVLLVLVWGVIINYIVKKIFSLFMD